MKKLLKVFLVLTMAFVVVACGGNNDTTGDKTVITVGISPDYPPYESLTTSNEVVGFDVDMMKLFEGYLTEFFDGEFTFDLRIMDFDNIVTSIQGDQVDLGISGFTYAEDRDVEWSKPYTSTNQVAVMPVGTTVKTVADLEGKAIAAQAGSTGEYAAEDIEGATVSTLKDVQNMFAGLAANQYDAVIVDIAVAKNYVNSGNFIMLEEPLLDEENYIIAKKGNTEIIEKINKCIDTFLASDDYNALCEQYGLTKLD